MAIEDCLHPLLSSYLASPQWVKNSIGRAYSWVPPTLTRGQHYKKFLLEAGMSDGAALQRLSAVKLATTLRRAIQTVPAYFPYRALLPQLDQPLAVLRQLPLVTKIDIRDDLSSFLALDMPEKQRLSSFTGGSTAMPMMFYLHKGRTRSKEYAYIEHFHQRAGMLASSTGDVVLAVRGRPVPTANQEGGKLWMYEPIKRQLILSSNHLERRYMEEYVAAIRRWKPTYIQAYPSTIYPLARWLKEHPQADITQRIKGVMLFSENVLDHHMSLLREVFSCPILKHYGQSERVLMAASMPDDDRCFFWPQYGHFELVDEAGAPITQPGILGEIVGTGFDNHVMPFIRYRTGDMAVLSERPHPLLPGYPVVERIEGRRHEFLVCRDHRLVSITSVTYGNYDDLKGVEAIQYEQQRPGHFILKVVTQRKLTHEARRRLVRMLETHVPCTAEVLEVKEIPRTRQGKHQMLVQHLDLSRYFGATI